MQKILGASRVAVSLYLGPLYAAAAVWCGHMLKGLHPREAMVLDTTTHNKLPVPGSWTVA